MKKTKEESRARIHYRIKKKVKGTSDRPRLAVYRSNKSIYAQLIDDLSGNVLTAASSGLLTSKEGINKVDQAKEVGKLIAERAKANNIESIVFDRSGYLYHGRIKALAEGAREAGLKF